MKLSELLEVLKNKDIILCDSAGKIIASSSEYREIYKYLDCSVFGIEANAYMDAIAIDIDTNTLSE